MPSDQSADVVPFTRNWNVVENAPPWPSVIGVVRYAAPDWYSIAGTRRRVCTLFTVTGPVALPAKVSAETSAKLR